MKRIHLVPIAALTAIGLALSGCSSSGGGGGATGAAGETKIKMVLWPGPEGDAMQKVVDAYNAGQGKTDKISVEMVLLSRDDTFAREGTEISSKSANVDIYFTASYNVGFFQQGLDPLTDLGVDETNYFPAAINGMKVDGTLLALPLDTSSHFLYYRTDLMDSLLKDSAQQAKYREVAKKVLGTEREPKAPEEWDADDYLAAAAYFSKSANPDSPTQYGTALQLKTSPFNTVVWDDLLWGLGGAWTDASGNATLTSDAAKKAMNIYRTIYMSKYTSPDSAQAEFAETNAALQSGNTAFAMHWSAAYAELTSKEKSPKIYDKIAAAPEPGNPHATHVHALAISLNKYSKNKEAAKTWMKYLATPEAMDAYAKAGGIPSMPKVLADNVDINPGFKEISEQVAEYGYALPSWSGTFEAMTGLAEELVPGWTGVKGVDESLEAANNRLTELLKKP